MSAKKILVADDEMAIRLLLSEGLKEEGYEVYTAANGREALEILQRCEEIVSKSLGYKVYRCSIDLVILDIKMPAMDGIEALKEIKERYPDLTVFLYTCYGELKQDFATWAADEFHVKSSELGDLFSAVKRWLKD